MIKKDVKVIVLKDAQDRPIANLVQIANEFKSRIYFESDGHSVNGKSIMGMMTLGLYPGEPVSVSADGEDEEQAIAAIESYLSGQQSQPY